MNISKLILSLLVVCICLCQRQPSPSADIGAKRNYMLGLINSVRAQQNTGLKKLYLDDILNSVAQAHSEDMCDRQFFDHVNPDGKSPDQRLRDIGLITANAENIAMGQTLLQMHRNLMNSPGHFRNTIGKDWTRAGVGISMCDVNEVYLTIVFASRDFANQGMQTGESSQLRQQLSSYFARESGSVSRTEDTALSTHIQNWLDGGKTPSSVFSYLSGAGYSSNGYMSYRMAGATFNDELVNGLRSRGSLANSNSMFRRFGFGFKPNSNGLVEVHVVYIQ